MFRILKNLDFEIVSDFEIRISNLQHILHFIKDHNDGVIRLKGLVQLTIFIQYRNIFNFVRNFYIFPRHANNSFMQTDIEDANDPKFEANKEKYVTLFNLVKVNSDKHLK